jgi:hypothetical protein
LKCKTWRCPECGPKKTRRVQKAIAQWAAELGLTRFLTLTLNPSACTREESVKYIRKVWSKFRVYLGRRYGNSITFIAVVELHPGSGPAHGYAHLHILVDRFIPQRWISATWERLGGGRVVDIKYGDVRRLPGYVAKYLTKEMLLADRPKRQRRYSTSRNIKLLSRASSGSSETWTRLDVPLEELFRTAMTDGLVVDAHFNTEETLERFVEAIDSG